MGPAIEIVQPPTLPPSPLSEPVVESGPSLEELTVPFDLKRSTGRGEDQDQVQDPRRTAYETFPDTDLAMIVQSKAKALLEIGVEVATLKERNVIIDALILLDDTEKHNGISGQDQGK